MARAMMAEMGGSGLTAYSDTGYSDIPAIVTVFWSIKGSPYTENPGYSDILLTVTLIGHPNTVTVSGEACILLPLLEGSWKFLCLERLELLTSLSHISFGQPSSTP